MENMDKSLFFITLAFICVWLIVDVAVGKNYLGNFLGSIFPFMKQEEAVMDEAVEVSTTEDKNYSWGKQPTPITANSNNVYNTSIKDTQTLFNPTK